MKKIIFVNTPLTDYSHKKKGNYRTMPPLGLAYVATMIKSLGFHVELLDGEAAGLSVNQIIHYIKANSFDTVCINILSPNYNIAKKIINHLPGLKIIAGGHHATLVPEKVLKETNTFIVVRNEGEFAIKDIFNNKPIKDISGISYKEGSRIIHNPKRPPIKNLDILPFIDRSLLNEPEEKSIVTSRGCPFNCIFCSSSIVNGKKIRMRTVKNIIQEILELQTKFNVSKIHFIDDNFIFSKGRIQEFINAINKKRIKIKWRALARVSTISGFDAKLMEAIKNSGCYQLTFGIESGNERILQFIKKGITKEQAIRAISLCKEAGIKTKAYFMLGFPSETRAEVQDTIDFAKSLGLNESCFVTVKAYPGTELSNYLSNCSSLFTYNQLKTMAKLNQKERLRLNNKGINIDKYLKYGTVNARKISNFSNKLLFSLVSEAYKQFYLGGENVRRAI